MTKRILFAALLTLAVAGTAGSASARWWGDGRWHYDNRYHGDRWYGYTYRAPPVVYATPYNYGYYAPPLVYDAAPGINFSVRIP